MIPITTINNLTKEFFDVTPKDLSAEVKPIIEAVRDTGDDAIKRFTKTFDDVDLAEFSIGTEEIKNSYKKVPATLPDELQHAAKNIRLFARQQLQQFNNFQYEVEPGVILGQRVIPLERVGVYVPGGRFPLVSSVLMAVIPAQVAGVTDLTICSPPTYQNSIHPSILMAADLMGVGTIYRIGGIQAIAALAYGTQTIKAVDKIVGPGNRYVTAAKKEVYGQVGIDFLAGPSEILIIADDTANPSIIASDLLAQAEHDPEAEAILVTNSPQLATQVQLELATQIQQLSTAPIARQSLKAKGRIILTNTITQAIQLANRKAPEHLELQTRQNNSLIPQLRNYGSLFIGQYAAEVLGDYTSGLNHTLPTQSASRYTSGLSVKNFLKLQTTLEVKSQGLQSIGPPAEGIAKIEGLMGHAQSIGTRLEQI